jgi:hypothetical protein
MSSRSAADGAAEPWCHEPTDRHHDEPEAQFHIRSWNAEPLFSAASRAANRPGPSLRRAARSPRSSRSPRAGRDRAARRRGAAWRPPPARSLLTETGTAGRRPAAAFRPGDDDDESRPRRRRRAASATS